MAQSKKSLDVFIMVLCSLVLTLLASLSVYFIMDSKINALDERLSSRSDVMMLDMDSSIKKLIDDGMKPAESVLYINTMMKVLKAKGVLVVDAKSVLSVPESAKIALIDEEKLYTVAQSLGLSPTDEDISDVKEAMEASQKMLDLSQYK